VASAGGTKAGRAAFGAPTRASPASATFERLRIGFAAAARVRAFFLADFFFADVFAAFGAVFFAGFFFVALFADFFLEVFFAVLFSAATFALTLRLLCQTIFD
jgi:hypothetical protein